MTIIQKIWKIWTRPLAPDEDQARQEYMTRVISLMVGTVTITFSVIVILYSFTSPLTDFESISIVLGADGVVALNALLVHRGYWRVSGYLLPAMFLSVGAYLTYLGGLGTTGIIFFLIAILLAAMLRGVVAQWTMVTGCWIIYLTFAWLHGERDYDAIITSGITVAGGFVGIALLQWFFTRQLQHALAQAHTITGELQKQIAERERIQVSLQQSEEKYRLIAENVADIIWTCDLAFNFQYISPSIKQMRGYTVEEAMKQSLEEIFTSASLELAIQTFGEEMQNEQNPLADPNRSRLIELEEYCKDGSTIWTENKITFLRDEHLQPVGIVGITRNVTERKRAETERESLIAKLESKNNELERFTYTVSHDLKAPLITIRGFLGFLQKDALAGNIERVKADVARITEATDKMHRLLNELLELSRVGRMMNPPVDVPFTSIAQEAITLVYGRLSDNVSVTIAESMPIVHGDRARLIQVVQNLIDNATKFMGDQPNPRIEIGASGTDQDGKSIFFVRDNGIGIEPQYHERVFGLFNKLDAKTEGTGIGLALVKRIVEVHGGRIWVESEGMGRGTTFYFTLPQSH